MSTKYRCFLLKNKLRTLAFSLTITLDICVNMSGGAAQCKTSISTFLLKSWTNVDWSLPNFYTVQFVFVHWNAFKKVWCISFSYFAIVFAYVCICNTYVHEHWQCDEALFANCTHVSPLQMPAHITQRANSSQFTALMTDGAQKPLNIRVTYIAKLIHQRAL